MARIYSDEEKRLYLVWIVTMIYIKIKINYCVKETLVIKL